MEADRSVRGLAPAEEGDLVKEKALQGRSDNPDRAGEQETAAKAAPSEEPANEKKSKDNNFL